MKKLKLNIEDLAVSSFEIDALEDERGTVAGAEVTGDCSVSCTDPFSSLYRWYRRMMTYDV